MNTRSSERILAAWLKWGTLSATALCLAGLAWMMVAGAPVSRADLASLSPCAWPCEGIPGGALVLVGVVALLGVGAGRLLLAAALFWRAGDRLYGALSLAGFGLVLAASAFATMG